MASYDAFISYSHAADAKLAPALQRALQRFAKPWWKLRALNLFRDETSLAAASNLSGALLRALDTSRYFILLASPRAAASRWCNEEVAHWLRHRSPGTLLIVLTEGAVAWDETAHDFDWNHTDALPPALRGELSTEPFWLDLSWARRSEQVSERDPRFQQVVAKLAATLHGRSLEDISGEDVRQHRRTRHVAISTMAAVVTLAVGAGAAAWKAIEARDAAERSEREATLQRDHARRVQARLTAQLATVTLERGDFGAALALALEALPRDGIGNAERPYVTEAERVLRAVTMAPLREIRALRIEDSALVALADGAIAVLQDFRKVTDGKHKVDLRVLDAPSGRTLAVLSGHSDSVSAAVVSDDGRTLLSGSTDGTARLWDIAGRCEIAVFGGHPSGNPLVGHIGVALSHDGRHVVTASSDGMVRLWRGGGEGQTCGGARTAEPSVVVRCGGQGFPTPSILFAPDDHAIAVGCPSGPRLWSFEREAEIALAPPTRRVTWTGRPMLAFAGGRLFAAGKVLRTPLSGLSGPFVWDSKTGAFERAMNIPVGSLHAARNGMQVVAASEDGTALVWKAGTYDTVVMRHDAAVTAARVLPDDSRLVTVAADGTARLWDTGGRQLALWRGFTGAPYSIALSKDETMVALGGGTANNSVHVWAWQNPDVREMIPSPPTIPRQIKAIAISADGSRIAAGFVDGTVNVWRASGGAPIAVMTGGERAIEWLMFSPADASRLVTFGNGAILWNVDTRQPIARLVDPQRRVQARRIAYAGNGKVLATGDSNGVVLWDGNSGEYLRSVAVDSAIETFRINDLSLSRDGRRVLATGRLGISGQETVGQVWEGVNWAERVTFRSHVFWQSAVLAADGASILVATDNEVRLLGPHGEGDGTLVGRLPMIGTAIFAPDGRTVLSIDSGAAHVWSSQKVLAEFPLGQHALGQVAFSPDGRHLLVLSPDGRIRLSDVSSGAPLALLPDERAAPIGFAGDGILTQPDNGVLHLWRAPPTTSGLVEYACSLLTRPLSRAQRQEYLLDEDPKDPPCGWHPYMKEKPPYVPKAAIR